MFDKENVKVGDEVFLVEVDNSSKGLRVIQFVSREATVEWEKMHPGINKEEGIEAIKVLIADLARPWWFYYEEMLRDKFENEGRAKVDEAALFAHQLKHYETMAKLFYLFLDVLNIHETHFGPMLPENGVCYENFGVDPFEVSDAIVIARTIDAGHTFWLWSRKKDIPEFLSLYLENLNKDTFPSAVKMGWVAEIVWARSQGLIVF
jgi:hypothetical protein